MQVLAQVPVLWVWDNIEPVTGFPPGTPSPWTQAEQDDLEGFLRDLATQLPVQGAADLPPRRTSLARRALPARCGCRRCRCANASSSPPRSQNATARSRPGRTGGHCCATPSGNPLTITVLVGQALREGPHHHQARSRRSSNSCTPGKLELEPG